MAGGLRRSSALLKELESDTRALRVILENQAWIIRNMAPVNAHEKELRPKLLLATRNVIAANKVRPSLAATPAPVVPLPAPVPKIVARKDDAPKADPPEPSDEPPPPTPLRVEFVQPTGPVPRPRAGSTAGDPFTLDQITPVETPDE